MLKVFRETQQNMIELNKSRLAALEEVKQLRARVSLLGEDPPHAPSLSLHGDPPLKLKVNAEAEVQELEQDAYEGKRQPLESPSPVPLHNEPGAYVPQVCSVAMPASSDVPHNLIMILGQWAHACMLFCLAMSL